MVLHHYKEQSRYILTILQERRGCNHSGRSNSVWSVFMLHYTPGLQALWLHVFAKHVAVCMSKDHSFVPLGSFILSHWPQLTVRFQFLKQ